MIERISYSSRVEKSKNDRFQLCTQTIIKMLVSLCFTKLWDHGEVKMGQQLRNKA